MVGDDGRVRVFDFGLARSVGVQRGGVRDEDNGGTQAPMTSSLGAEMTIVGSILGTPAYMAPEQFLAGATDARTDVFAFCVALYEALYRQRPFPGATFQALRESVCRGAVAPPPPDSSVPLWLRALVLRGLLPASADRWQTVDALLTALADDPLARRRRWLRTAAWFVAGTGLALALVIGIAALRARLAERAREEAAARQWASIAARVLAVDADTPDAAAAEAEGLFHAFVTSADARGTRALTEAWLARGRGFYERGDGERAMAAFASAYSGASSGELERSTLLAIASVFRARWDIRALTPLVRLLRGDDDAAIDPPVDALRIDAAIDRRDFMVAAGLLDRLGEAAPPHLRGIQPALRRLARATDLGPIEGSAPLVVDLDRDGRDELLLTPLDPARVSSQRELLLRDFDGGPPRAIASLAGYGAARPVPDSPFVFVQHLADPNQWSVLELSRTEAPRERWRGAFVGGGVYSTCADDLDGDGVPEIYVTLTAYRRGLFRVDLARDGSLAVEPAKIVDAQIERLNSDGQALRTDDLDGDGRRELIVGLGPWSGYDLRILRWAGAGHETVAHAEIGSVRAVATFAGADGQRWVAAETGSDTNRTIFPTPPHTGSTPGVHLFRLAGDRLVRGATLPPLWSTLQAGDVDGDGRDDLIYAGGDVAEGAHRLFVMRQGADGGFSPIGLGFANVATPVQADDDPEVELLVLADDHAWLLGHGPTDTPIRPEVLTPPRPPPPGLTDPALVSRWERADRLVVLGLEGLAARALLDLAELVAPDLRAQVLDRAAELFGRAGDRRRALEVLGDLAADPAYAASAALAAAGHHAADGDYVAADAALAGVTVEAGSEAFSPFTPAELHQVADPRRRLRLTFDHPIDPAWRFGSPSAVRRDPTSARLVITASDLHGPWATLPLTWDGGPILVRVELDVTAMEYSSDLRVRLAAGEETAVETRLLTTGGDGVLARFFDDMDGPVGSLGEAPAEAPLHVSFTIAIAADAGRVTIFSRADDKSFRRELKLRRALAGAPLRLELGGRQADRSAGQLRGTLREVELIGLRPGTPSDEPRARAVAALVEGRSAAAAELLGAAAIEGPRDRLALALALAEQRRWGDARAMLAPLAAADDDFALWSDLCEYYRGREAMRPIITEVLAARMHDIRMACMGLPAIQHQREPLGRRLLLEEFAGVGAWEPTQPDLVKLGVQLLVLRIGTLRVLGEVPAALAEIEATRARLSGLPTALYRTFLREEARVRLAAGDRAGARRVIEDLMADLPEGSPERPRMLRDPTLQGLFDEPPGP
jgi:hypothetical protein